MHHMGQQGGGCYCIQLRACASAAAGQQAAGPLQLVWSLWSAHTAPCMLTSTCDEPRGQRPLAARRFRPGRSWAAAWETPRQHPFETASVPPGSLDRLWQAHRNYILRWWPQKRFISRRSPPRRLQTGSSPARAPSTGESPSRSSGWCGRSGGRSPAHAAAKVGLTSLASAERNAVATSSAIPAASNAGGASRRARAAAVSVPPLARPPKGPPATCLLRCRATIAKDGPPSIPYASLYEMFQDSVKKYPDNNCLGHREGAGYAWLTYKQTEEQVGGSFAKAG